MPAPTVLTPADRADALPHLPDWRYSLGFLHTAYDCGTPAAALALIAAIGAAAQQRDHHPDVDWRYRHVFLRCSTHSVGGQVTDRDIDLAGAVSVAAAHAQVTAVPILCRTIEIAIDTVDPAVIAPAWASALGYVARPDGELADPHRRGPGVWFQRTDFPDPSRIHIDVQVEDSSGDDVLAQAETAGAHRIDDRFRPAFTVLADGDGNRVCICTNLGRD